MSGQNEVIGISPETAEDRRRQQRRDYARRYYEQHREEIAAYQRAYRERHQEEISARWRRYYEQHRKEIIAHNVAVRREKMAAAKRAASEGKLTEEATE